MPPQWEVVFCLEGKGAYGFLTKCKGQAASGFAKNLPLSLRASVFFAKTLTLLKPTPYSPRNKKTTDATMTQKIKKMSLIMVNNEKIIKTKKLPPLGINIRFCLLLAGLAAVAGLIWACGTTVPAVIGVYLGYRVLRLVIRLTGLLLSILFTVISIIILMAIISLLIF
jgi:hypothetical protein